MNIALWVLQIVLALHTAVGAVWKFSHSAEQTMPSLKAIPSGAWLTLAGLELLCALGLVLAPFFQPFVMLVPLAATLIVLEMLLFCVLHLSAGGGGFGPMIYWLVVAALAALIAYGRFALRPF